MDPALCCCREQRIHCPGKESTSTGLLRSQQLHVVFCAPNCTRNLETCYANETLFSCDFAAFLILLFHSGAVRSHLHGNNRGPSKGELLLCRQTDGNHLGSKRGKQNPSEPFSSPAGWPRGEAARRGEGRFQPLAFLVDGVWQMTLSLPLLLP